MAAWPSNLFPPLRPSFSAKFFRVVKARRAKYGFYGLLHIDSLVTLAEAKQDLEHWDPAAEIVLRMERGTNEIRMYTNDQAVADAFKQKYC